MKGQTKLHSWYEAWMNVAIGFAINFLANLAILPLFGFSPSLWQNFQIGILFTAVSVARSYGLRRVFNLIHVRQNEKRSLQAPQREAQ